jgi:small-conductance mechanosensitive channel
MPEYTLAESTRSEELDRTATAAAALARVDIQRADNYVLCAVLFAAVLFFAGFATRLQGQGPRLAVLGIGAAMFVGTLVWMATFPISVGV